MKEGEKKKKNIMGKKEDKMNEDKVIGARLRALQRRMGCA